MTHAPVIATARHISPAPPDEIWARLLAVDSWTTWHPDVSWVSAPGPLRLGTMFEFVWRGRRARAIVTRLDADDRHLRWASDTSTGRWRQRWHVTAYGRGSLLSAEVVLFEGANIGRRRAATRVAAERALDRWNDALGRAVPVVSRA